MAELGERVTWQEVLGWIAFYTWESDQSLPPEKRPLRARTPEQAAAALDFAFKIKRN